jgi:AraC-like DNA-binding protein
VRSAPVGGANAAEIASCTQRIEHGHREVARTPEDVVFINLQLEGRCVTIQDGRHCTVSRGEFAVVDSTRPYSLEFLEPESEGSLWRVLSFRLPRTQLADVMTPESSTTARSFAGATGSARLLRSLMLETWQTDSSLTSIERQMISAAHIDLVRAVLGGALEREKQLDGDTDHLRRIAALRYVETHLPFGRISATQTAHYLGVSVRALHALFERSGTTFGALVRQSRLEACRRDLADPRNDSSIAAIAAMWGYADSAHLAKAFRAQFDCSPSDYRSTQQHDTGPSHT